MNLTNRLLQVSGVVEATDRVNLVEVPVPMGNIESRPLLDLGRVETGTPSSLSGHCHRAGRDVEAVVVVPTRNQLTSERAVPKSDLENPHRLDVGRGNASRHVGWGHGPHYCLGARLAHMEIAALLDGLARGFTSIEPTGPTEWTKAHFVGGAKHVPVRMRAE